MIHVCGFRYCIYLIPLLVASFFIVLHVIFENGREHRWEPLFPIDKSLEVIHVKLSSNFSTPRSHLENEVSGSAVKSLDPRRNLKNCSDVPIKFHGRITLIKEPASSFQVLLEEFNRSSFQKDGHYQPRNCVPQYQIAIIIPYRDRLEHLNILMRNLHPFLQKQLIDYTIFIIEQAGGSPFNRGKLLNVGFVEAMNIRPFDCFIFHDVDLLPEDDRNLYNCPEQPRHMSVAVDVFKYKLPYIDIFGGVSAMSTKHFQLVNGFSNTFWGWGGEGTIKGYAYSCPAKEDHATWYLSKAGREIPFDDDMSMRIKMKGLHVMRYPLNVARYTMLPHKKATTNPRRYEKLFYGRKRFKTEGLNSLEYQRIAIHPCKLFTWVFVELRAPSEDEYFSNIFKKSYFGG